MGDTVGREDVVGSLEGRGVVGAGVEGTADGSGDEGTADGTETDGASVCPIVKGIQDKTTASHMQCKNLFDFIFERGKSILRRFPTIRGSHLSCTARGFIGRSSIADSLLSATALLSVHISLLTAPSSPICSFAVVILLLLL